MGCSLNSACGGPSDGQSGEPGERRRGLHPCQSPSSLGLQSVPVCLMPHPSTTSPPAGLALLCSVRSGCIGLHVFAHVWTRWVGRAARTNSKSMIPTPPLEGGGMGRMGDPDGWIGGRRGVCGGGHRRGRRRGSGEGKRLSWVGRVALSVRGEAHRPECSPRAVRGEAHRPECSPRAARGEAHRPEWSPQAARREVHGPEWSPQAARGEVHHP